MYFTLLILSPVGDERGPLFESSEFSLLKDAFCPLDKIGHVVFKAF